MMMVSTVGTSVLAKRLDAGEGARLYELANLRADEAKGKDETFLRNLADRARNRLLDADEDEVRLLSAELNGIIAYDAELKAAGKRPVDQHVLVATDTMAGRLAADVVAAKLESMGSPAAILAIDDLQTADLGLFRAGCSNLAREMWNLVDGGRVTAKAGGLLFNLTGGFKGVNAFLQTVALALGAEAVYVFESSKRLMRIPRLPMTLAATAEVERHLPIYRRLDAGETVSAAEAASAGLSDAMLLVDSGMATLSEYGDVLYPIALAELAEKSLFEPRRDVVRFSNRFRSEAEKLPPNRLRQVNEAVETLVRRLEGKPEGELKRHTFKPLKGDPKPPATHELYLWSDQAAGRAFLRQTEEGSWEFTEMDGHL